MKICSANILVCAVKQGCLTYIYTGVEQNRLDAFSDLDFFAIVEPGYKPNYLANLDWLSAISPIAYHFPNTDDGYKLLYADGIFCEFAVFEPDELQAIPFAAGRVVWKRPEVAETIAQSTKTSPNRPRRDQAWLLGEALTNLSVGMGRLCCLAGQSLTMPTIICVTVSGY
jgi:lincosamide nucleotidyltransferase B/F